MMSSSLTQKNGLNLQESHPLNAANAATTTRNSARERWNHRQRRRPRESSMRDPPASRGEPADLDDRRGRGPRRPSRGQDGFGVFPDLLGGLKDLLERPLVIVL